MKILKIYILIFTFFNIFILNTNFNFGKNLYNKNINTKSIALGSAFAIANFITKYLKNRKFEGLSQIIADKFLEYGRTLFNDNKTITDKVVNYTFSPLTSGIEWSMKKGYLLSDSASQGILTSFINKHVDSSTRNNFQNYLFSSLQAYEKGITISGILNNPFSENFSLGSWELLSCLPPFFSGQNSVVNKVYNFVKNQAKNVGTIALYSGIVAVGVGDDTRNLIAENASSLIGYDSLHKEIVSETIDLCYYLKVLYEPDVIEYYKINPQNNNDQLWQFKLNSIEDNKNNIINKAITNLNDIFTINKKLIDQNIFFNNYNQLNDMKKDFEAFNFDNLQRFIKSGSKINLKDYKVFSAKGSIIKSMPLISDEESNTTNATIKILNNLENYIDKTDNKKKQNIFSSNNEQTSKAVSLESFIKAFLYPIDNDSFTNDKDYLLNIANHLYKNMYFFVNIYKDLKHLEIGEEEYKLKYNEFNALIKFYIKIKVNIIKNLILYIIKLNTKYDDSKAPDNKKKELIETRNKIFNKIISDNENNKGIRDNENYNSLQKLLTKKDLYAFSNKLNEKSSGNNFFKIKNKAAPMNNNKYYSKTYNSDYDDNESDYSDRNAEGYFDGLDGPSFSDYVKSSPSNLGNNNYFQNQNIKNYRKLYN